MLEAFLSPGSELWMFNEVPEKEREKKLTDGGIDLSGLTNIRLVHKEGNAVIRRHLESLPLETFDSVSMQNFRKCLICQNKNLKIISLLAHLILLVKLFF